MRFAFRFLVGFLAASTLVSTVRAAPFAYIANSQSSDVSVIDVATDAVVETVSMAHSPSDVAVAPDGSRVYVATRSPSTISAIDTRTGAVTEIPTAGNGPVALAVTPDGSRIYVVYTSVVRMFSNSVGVYDTATFVEIARIPIGQQPAGIAVTPDGRWVYVTNDFANNVSVISTVSNAVVGNVAVGDGPKGIAIAPDGAHAYVANSGMHTGVAGSVSVIGTATRAVVATIPVEGSPFGVAVTPDGTQVYVANGESVSVISTFSNTVSATVVVGRSPLGLAVTPDGSRVYVANFYDDNVSVISTATNTVVGGPIAVGRGPKPFGLFIGAGPQPARNHQANYQGLWWNAPPLSESGWGINFAHQGDTIFATWYTYDTSGDAWWLSMTANKTAEGTYSGTLLRTTGPAFNAIPFDPAKVTRWPVGSGTLTFSDVNSGQFSYTVEGVQQTKTLTRQVFGPQPDCSWSTQPNLAGASNYQDLWWVANGAESGWGVNLTHQGDTIFATWFTYDFDGSVLWLSATTPKVDTGLYNGTLYRTSGPAFNAQPFDPNRVTRTPVGTLNIKFSDGNKGTFTYSLYGVTQTKAITRQVFYAPAATGCNNPLAASVALDVPTSSPWIGESMQLIAVARDASGYVIPGKAASWASSAPRVASVSSTGVVQALATGTVVITATIDGVSDTKTLTVTPMPRISVTVGTTKEVVFRWATDRCEDLDTPDLPVHVVRAEDGSLVLFSGQAPRNYVSRGVDFNSLKRDCSRPVLASAERPTPESYENLEWIGAVYREGDRWHAFISNEFHDAISSTCKPGDNTPSNPCWYNSTTYAISTDGAHTFVKPMAPAHVVGPPPNVWKAPLPGELPNFEGYGGPFSLVRRGDGFVYGITSVDPSHSEPMSYHPCLIRTDNLGDPASWRAWDGTGFSFRMVSPYVLGAPAPICQFVPIPGFLITFNTYLDRFLYLGNYSGPWGEKPACGFYFSLSPDLFHWSPLQLVAPMRDDSVCPFDPQQPGLLEPVPVMYPTVIDHADTTTNFERPGRTPYLYYVRFNRGTINDPLYWLDRDLVRVPLTFTRID